MTENTPEYLNREKKNMDRSLIARYKCRNDMRGSQYWREVGDRLCRTAERSRWWYMTVRECVSTREEITVGEFLGEDGKSLGSNEKYRTGKTKSTIGRRIIKE